VDDELFPLPQETTASTTQITALHASARDAFAPSNRLWM
jgi:hypothetical protein